MTQNIESVIRKLQAYNDRSFPILSVYLNIPRLSTGRNTKLRQQFAILVNNALKQEEAAILQQDLNYIDGFLHNYQQTEDYRGIAIFSGDNKLWEMITIRDPFQDSLILHHSPYLEPLMRTISIYRRFLVILADREKARYFTMHMGQIETQGGIIDPIVQQKVKSQGAVEFQSRTDRHILAQLNRHLNYIGRQVVEFADHKPIAGVILGGHKTILRNLKEHLPRYLQQRIVGEFITELDTNINKTLSETKKLIKNANDHLNQQQIIAPL